LYAKGDGKSMLLKRARLSTLIEQTIEFIEWRSVSEIFE